MYRPALLSGAVSALLVLCVAIVAHHSAQATENESQPIAAVELRLALRLNESNEPDLYLDGPISDDLLRLLNGQEKHPTVFLTSAKGTPYAKIVKVIDRLGALGIHKISLDVKHNNASL